MIDFNDFSKLDIRVGTIIQAEFFEEAIKPAYKLKIDFGPLGFKKTSAQITELYKIDDLIGKKIIAVVNLLPKQIANFISEVLVLGVYTDAGVVLLSLNKDANNGDKIG